MRGHPELAAVGPARTNSSFAQFIPEPRTYVVAEEAQLIDQTVAGDRFAARAIYDAHVMPVYRLASRMVGPDLAEECTQDTFVRAFERLGTFRREAALGTWLHSITVSVALNMKRREKRRANHLSIDFVPDVSSDVPESDPLLRRRLAVAIDSLDEGLRAVVVLNLIEGRTHVEIGEILGIPEGTSKARLSRAAAQLREALADIAPSGYLSS